MYGRAITATLQSMRFYALLVLLQVVNTAHGQDVSIAHGAIASQLAVSKEDPVLGFDAVFPPVPSCLSNVILVIYVQFLDMLESLEEYTDMYGPYVAGIEFYVDGTWCDPRNTSSTGRPCYGESLDRSSIPDEVHVVDGNGGGWMMQRSFVDAASRPREDGDTPPGFLFVSDDALLNIGQLSRAANVSGCDVIWRSANFLCQDVNTDGQKNRVFKRFLTEARAFYEVSDDRFRAQLTRNLGSSSTYCMGTQNDFLYMPALFAEDWARVATQMTDVGLPFTYAFYTAIYGIARMEDMSILRSVYLEPNQRADFILRSASLVETAEPRCWKGSDGGVAELLASHIIHPNKLHHSKAEWDFAHTVNQPGVALDFARHRAGTTVDKNNKDSSIIMAYDEDAVMPFWCRP